MKPKTARRILTRNQDKLARAKRGLAPVSKKLDKAVRLAVATLVKE
jgi:hypothetical protein